MRGPTPSPSAAHPPLRASPYYNAWLVILSFFLLFAVHNMVTKDYGMAAKEFLLGAGQSEERVEQNFPKTAAEKAAEAKAAAEEYKEALEELKHIRLELDLIKKVVKELKLYETSLSLEEQVVLLTDNIDRL